MRREMQAMIAGAGVNVLEQLRRPLPLVPTNAEGNHVAIAKLNCQVEHLLRFLCAELPDRVEDPEQRNAEIPLSPPPAAFEPLEDRGEILLPPEADTDRDKNLGMQDILRLQPLHHPVRDQFVVFRGAQVLGNILERAEKTCEVRVAVKPLDLGEGSAVLPMTLHQLDQGRRLDRTFQMEMEFGLGQGHQERIGCRRGTHSADCRRFEKSEVKSVCRLETLHESAVGAQIGCLFPQSNLYFCDLANSL